MLTKQFVGIKKLSLSSWSSFDPLTQYLSQTVGHWVGCEPKKSGCFSLMEMEFQRVHPKLESIHSKGMLMFKVTRYDHRFVAVLLLWTVGLGLTVRAGIVSRVNNQSGTPFSDAQKASLTNAIDLFGGLTITNRDKRLPLRECADCLKKMLAKNRLCHESGSINAGATTSGDDQPNCNPDSDLINVSEDKFPNPEMLAAALAHEWCHAAQANPVGTAPYEIPCYEVEIAVLKGLLGSAAAGNRQAISNRIDQMLTCITNLRASLGTNALIFPRTPAFGGRIINLGDKTFSVFCDKSALQWGDSMTPLQSFPLETDRPFELKIIPQGNEFVALVSGLLRDNLTGTIEALLLRGSEVIHLSTTILERSHPFSFDYNPATSRLYVLDTLNDQVLVYSLEAPFTSPGRNLGVFASKKFAPGLEFALSLSLVGNGNGRDLLLRSGDSRYVDAVPDMAEMTWQLLDPLSQDRASMVMQGRLGGLYQLEPGVVGPIPEGVTTISVFGSPGSSIQIANADLGRLSPPLGIGTIPGDSTTVEVKLNRPVVAGEALAVVDFSNLNLRPYSFFVGLGPDLKIEWSDGEAVLSWDRVLTGYSVEMIPDLRSPNRSVPLPLFPVVVGDRNQVRFRPNNSPIYFRISHSFGRTTQAGNGL